MKVAYGLRSRLRRSLIALGEAEREAAFGRATFHRYSHGELLVAPTTLRPQVFYIEAGRVRLVLHGPQNHDKVVCILGPGAMVGESALQAMNRQTSAYALGMAETYAWDLDVALELLETNLAFTAHVITSLALKTKLFAAQIEALSFYSAAERVARTFSNLAEVYGEQTRQGIRIPLRLTQEDIGEMANASRVTVSKVFSQLKREGLITKHRGCFIVRDVQRISRWVHNQECTA
mgnify:CR=1 FL=1